jgi:hypothetical protein
VADGSHAKEVYLKKVGPNLYRTTSGIYYLLVKRGGKQFRRSLRTTDQALARRRLREFQDGAARLTNDSNDRILRFEEISARWERRIYQIPIGQKPARAMLTASDKSPIEIGHARIRFDFATISREA